MKTPHFLVLFLSAALLASCNQPSVPVTTSQDSADTVNSTVPVDTTENTSGEGAETIVPDPTYQPTDTAGTQLDAQALNAWPVLKSGSNGQDVKALQYLLRARGKSVSVDGVFGPGTQSAVKAFQSSRSLASDGVVGPQTWQALLVTVQQGSTGEAVKAVQMYVGATVDGVFGAGTASAVKAFQSRNHLSADGVVGPQTWQALIAGVSTNPTLPPGTERDNILKRAKVWVDAHIPYSMSGYHDGWRTDCSGFVSMAWNLRSSTGGKISANTASLWNYSTELSNIYDLQPGDAVDSSEPNGATGGANHVVLFVKWLDKTNHIFLAYEEKGTAYGTVSGARQLIRSGNVWNMKGSSRTSWHFLRRKGL